MAWIRLTHVNNRFSSVKICKPNIIQIYGVQRRGLVESSVNHYDVLGLKPSASPSQIKSAYYQLSKKYHPDVAVGVNDAKEKFAKLSTAYEVLSSPEKRAVYDRGLHPGVGGHPAFTPDIEYREFLRRRGSFHTRTSNQAATSNRAGAAPGPDAWSSYEQHFRQHFYGRTPQQRWQAQKNFQYRMRQGHGHPIGVLWSFFMLTTFLFLFAANDP